MGGWDVYSDCHPWAMYSTFQFECTEASTPATTTTTSSLNTTASISSSYVRGSTGSNPSSSMWTSQVRTSTTASVYASAALYYNSSMLIATEMSSFLVGPTKTSYESGSAAANSTATSAFAAGAARLSCSLNCAAAVVAVMGTLPALIYM